MKLYSGLLYEPASIETCNNRSHGRSQLITPSGYTRQIRHSTRSQTRTPLQLERSCARTSPPFFTSSGILLRGGLTKHRSLTRMGLNSGRFVSSDHARHCFECSEILALVEPPGMTNQVCLTDLQTRLWTDRNVIEVYFLRSWADVWRVLRHVASWASRGVPS